MVFNKNEDYTRGLFSVDGLVVVLSSMDANADRDNIWHQDIALSCGVWPDAEAFR